MGNVLTWKDIDYNPISTGSRGSGALLALNDGLSGLQEGVRGWETRMLNDAAVRGQADMMRYTTPEEFEAASRAGNLQIAPGNETFAQNRANELYVNAGLGLDNINQGLVNTNQGIANTQAQTNLDQDITEFDDKQATAANLIKVQPILAEVARLANSNTKEGRAQAEQMVKDNAILFGQAGLDAGAGVDSILAGMGLGLKQEETQDTFDRKIEERTAKDQSVPILAEIARLESLGTPEGAQAAQKMWQDNATLLSLGGATVPQGISSAVPDSTTGAGNAAALDAAVEAGVIEDERKAAVEEVNKINASNPYPTIEDALEDINTRTDLSTREKQTLAAQIQASKDQLWHPVDPILEQQKLEEEQAARNAEAVTFTAVPDAAPSDPKALADALARDAEQGYVNPNLTGAMLKQKREQEAEAAEQIRLIGVDRAFEGNNGAVLRAFEKPSEIDISQVSPEVKAAFQEVSPGKPDTVAEEQESASMAQFRDEVERIQKKYNVRPDIALALAKGAISQAPWWKPWEGNDEVDTDLVDDYVSGIIDLSEPNEEKRMAKAATTLRLEAAKDLSVSNLQTYQKQYDSAMTSLYSVYKQGNPEAIAKATRRMTTAAARLETESRRVKTDPSTYASSRPVPNHR